MYSVNQHPINTLLSWVNSKEIAIPEIQRPFVWKTTKIRDLVDSLYKEYPVGYIIVWKNPDVELKDGTKSEGKKILIDGQQRITALRAAILGKEIMDQNYKQKKVKIAFHPVEEKFETLTPAIKKDKEWIPDISKVLSSERENLFSLVRKYHEKNPEVSRDIVEKSIEKLLGIGYKQVGIIELDASLDIETVTEIFIRINSEGVVLSQADFAMSKIASYDDKNYGLNLRKCIDYFCHLAKEPVFYKNIEENDIDFSNTEYFSKIKWLKNESDELYDPDYSDVLRVAFTKQFKRGRMSELVSLLSGRDFETRKFKHSIMKESFENLREGILDFVNETNFKRFIMIIKSCGFIDQSLIRSKNVINFAYILFLTLKDKGVSSEKIEKYVQKWFIMSILTQRYSGSPESKYDYDIKRIHKKGIEDCLLVIEEADLSDNFWNVSLVDQLERAIRTNPLINVFFAAQVKENNKGFLSSDITVANMINHRGDIHHLFPKAYLRDFNKRQSEYNQIANYVYAQSEINIRIGKKSPKEYMGDVLAQCEGGSVKYGGIVDKKELYENLKVHCVPEEIFQMTAEDYEEFLKKRRKLIAEKIKRYYFGISCKKESQEKQESQEDDYLKIIENGENDYIEFKSSLRWDIQENQVNKNLEYSIAKTIAAFLNSNGGRLFIGVSDDGNILGLGNDFKVVKNKNMDGFLIQLDQVINSYLGKDVHQYIIIHTPEIKGKQVCIVEVLNSGRPVYLQKKEGDSQDFFIRASASSQPLSMKEANEYMKNHWPNG